MVHGDQGEIITTTVVNEEPPKPRTYIKKPSIRLVYCRPFPPERPVKHFQTSNKCFVFYCVRFAARIFSEFDAVRVNFNGFPRSFLPNRSDGTGGGLLGLSERRFENLLLRTV